MTEPHRIIIIAGPNGVGKTTFAHEFLPREAHCPDFINADLIAAGLSPFNPDAAALPAGRLMLEEMALRLADGLSFAFETTLSGVTYARRIPEWKRQGYHVKVVFLSLPTVDMAIARVSARVAQGGHDVSEAVIRRRFDAGLQNFDRMYKPLVNAWVHYDNSGPLPLDRREGQLMSSSMPTTPNVLRDTDLLPVGEALKRAARRAQQIAQQTVTPFYIWRAGRVVNVGAVPNPKSLPAA